MEKQVNSSRIFSHEFRHWKFFKRPKQIWKERTSKLKSSRTESSSCQCSNYIDWPKRGNDEIYIECRKIKDYAMKFLQGHWTIPGPGSEKKWHGGYSHTRRGEWDSTANVMVQRFKEICHLVFQNSNALNRGILKRKKGFENYSLQWEIRETQNSCSKQFILWISSVLTEQWRSGANNSPWQRKRRDEIIHLWTKVYWQVYHHMKYNFRCLFARQYSELRSIVQQNSVFKTMWRRLASTSCFGKDDLKKLDQTTTDMGNLFHLIREYTLSRANPQSRVFAAIPDGNDHWTSSGSANREHSWTTWTWNCMSINPQTRNEEERSVLWMKFMSTQMSSDPAQNYSQHFINQKGENLVWKKKNPTASKETCAHPLTSRDGNKGRLCKQSQQSSQWIFFKKTHSYEQKKWLLLTPILRTEELCRYKYPR